VGNDLDEVARIVVRDLLDTDPEGLDIAGISEYCGYRLSETETDDVCDIVAELLRGVRENFNEGNKND